LGDDDGDLVVAVPPCTTLLKSFDCMIEPSTAALSSSFETVEPVVALVSVPPRVCTETL